MKKIVIVLVVIAVASIVFWFVQKGNVKGQNEEALKIEQAAKESAQQAATALYDEYVKSSDRLFELVEKVTKGDQGAIQEYTILNNKLKKASVELQKQDEFFTPEQKDQIREYSKKLADARKETGR